jgi:hypothetical protein
MARRITVGVPVYKGVGQVGKALASLQQQTFRDFEVVISVDGADEESAAECRPFLADDRFRMVVHRERLDWFGNVNWLLSQPIGDFFCYRQHDDTTTPDFFEVLLRAAEARPDAAGIYADCQWVGGRSDLETAPSIEGSTLHRMRQYIDQLQPVAVRGILRREAVQQAGPVRSNEFRGLSEVFVWLAKVLRWGSFIRVPEPLYLRLDHEGNYHKQWHDWPDERKRASWSTMFTGMLEATMPVCETFEERVFFQQYILDRIAVVRDGQPYLYMPSTPHQSGVMMLECLMRLKTEGNEFLFGDLPYREQAEENRRLRQEHAALAVELEILQRSRALKLARRVRKLLGISWQQTS